MIKKCFKVHNLRSNIWRKPHCLTFLCCKVSIGCCHFRNQINLSIPQGCQNFSIKNPHHIQKIQFWQYIAVRWGVGVDKSVRTFQVFECCFNGLSLAIKHVCGCFTTPQYQHPHSTHQGALGLSLRPAQTVTCFTRFKLVIYIFNLPLRTVNHCALLTLTLQFSSLHLHSIQQGRRRK